jgi:hypothetical protein
MGKYINPLDIWRTLGKDAYTKTRGETLSTSSANVWSTDNDNLISGSVVVYDGGTQVTSGTSIDYDDGYITYTASGTVTADYDYSQFPDSKVQDIISSSESMLDAETGRNFDLTTGSVEYHDFEYGQDTLFTDQFPITSFTSLERNKGDEVSPNWETLTSGLGNDYYSVNDDLDIGKVNLIQNFPTYGRNRYRVTYTYGYSAGSIPSAVKQLAVLYSLREMVGSSVWKATYAGLKDFNLVNPEILNGQIEAVKRQLAQQSITKV